MRSFLPYFSAETWTLLVLLITLIVVYGYWPYGYFTKLGIPGPKPLPFVGTMMEYKKGFFNFDSECFQKYGRIWGIYDGRQPVLCTMDRTMIKTILIKECYNIFTNRRNFQMNGELYDGLTVAEDDTWKRIRSVLSPSFTTGRLKEVELSLHFVLFFGPYSMDVVTSTAFSVNIDSLNNPSDPFVSNIKKMLKFDLFSPLLFFIIFFPFMAPICQMLNFSFFPAEVLNFFYASLAKIKSERGLSDHEILSQAMIFIFAGYETTSSTLSFLAYNLATNPHVMTKLQEEIDTVFPNKAPIQYEALMQMEYLDSVLNESLRLYPIAPRLERVAKKTVEINGIIIPKDCVVLVPTWTLHRDPEIWSDPEEFKPERFSKENKESIDPYSYMPFGAGPRNCIGMRFALIMIKLAMVEILQSYTFTACEETQIPLEMDIQGLLMPKQPIKLKLEPRSNTSRNKPTTSLTPNTM
uniref:unspecific monooxygenase n=1 Tax=Esox lucius TaxID=8010 RepID=A0A6Q2XIK4_ESOLU